LGCKFNRPLLDSFGMERNIALLIGLCGARFGRSLTILEMNGDSYRLAQSPPERAAETPRKIAANAGDPARASPRSPAFATVAAYYSGALPGFTPPLTDSPASGGSVLFGNSSWVSPTMGQRQRQACHACR